MATEHKVTLRRKARVRRALKAHAYGKPRLSVFRSSKQIYCQIIDDAEGKTLASASSLEKANREALKSGATVEAAQGHRQADRRTGDPGRGQGDRLRPRRLYVSWARQGTRRRRPRRRTEFLSIIPKTFWIR